MNQKDELLSNIYEAVAKGRQGVRLDLAKGSGLTYGYLIAAPSNAIKPVSAPGLPNFPLIQSTGGLTEHGPVPAPEA